MNITYYGHSCFGVETMGKHILFDPFISPNDLASNIDIDSIPADFILISHGHQDHVADVESIAKRTGATLVSNYEIITWYGGKGLEKGLPMNHGGSWNTDVGKIKYVNAIHSSTLPDGSGGGNPGGFILENEEGSFYYSGDTALTYDMKLLGEYHKLDFAFLCMGDIFTMGVEDAVIASEFIKCDTIIGMHYDTFPPIKLDKAAAKSAFSAKGKTLHLLDIGGSMSI